MHPSYATLLKSTIHETNESDNVQYSNVQYSICKTNESDNVSYNLNPLHYKLLQIESIVTPLNI